MPNVDHHDRPDTGPIVSIPVRDLLKVVSRGHKVLRTHDG